MNLWSIEYVFYFSGSIFSNATFAGEKDCLDLLILNASQRTRYLKSSCCAVIYLQGLFHYVFLTTTKSAITIGLEQLLRI